MIRHYLFPTTISESQISEKIHKPTVMGQIPKYFVDGYTGEQVGMVTVHQNEDLRHLFSAIGEEMKKYLSSLSINPEIFDVQITKSWLNVVEKRHTPMHAHSESHFSFSYYLNVPETYTKPIIFHTRNKHPSEPYFGFFANNVSGWDEGNALTMSFVPKEGSLFIFPGSLWHETGGDGVYGVIEEPTIPTELPNKRICIAGDIILTHKDTTCAAAGLQPVSNWRVF